ERADRQLEGREGLAGARSIADPYLFVTTRWARNLGVDLAGFDHLEAFMQRMEADPGVRRALATES
ncbi:MAG: glutathione S-transferase family protein, partial [Dokdonella sp.]